MTETLVQILPETRLPGMRLGRHIEHDPRSRDFPAAAMQAGVIVPSVLHTRWAPILNQGDLGSCTGNAMAGALGTSPFVAAPADPVTEDLAVSIYELATNKFDSIPGGYPPDDTGSSGLAVAKAAKAMNLIAGYGHAFSIAHAVRALALAPVITGINWYDSFDTPGADGYVEISPNAQVRGGHEVEPAGYDNTGSIDLTKGIIRIANSWGPTWGDNGFFTMSVATWARLLEEGGDVTSLVA